jgi:glyoxylase-like metal-dependent hydrolase (beta-lactamase superfamily II)
MEPLAIHRYTFGPFAENTYVVVGRSGREAMIVDPGVDAEPVLDEVGKQGLTVTLLVNTHGHLDHVAGNAAFKRATGAPLAIHPADVPYLESVRQQALLYGLEAEDSPAPDLLLAEGKPLVFDGADFDVLHTPGHTADHLCLFDPAEGVVLSGDHVYTMDYREMIRFHDEAGADRHHPFIALAPNAGIAKPCDSSPFRRARENGFRIFLPRTHTIARGGNGLYLLPFVLAIVQRNFGWR